MPHPTPGPLVEARALRKSFGDQIAVDGIDLDLDRGVIIGLIGPSGCGKTTLVRMLAGIIEPTSGQVRAFGHDPMSMPRADRRRFGYMPQQPVLFPNLTVWGNLTFIASMYGQRLRGRRHRLMELLELVGLQDDRRKLLSECSGGMQRRLTLATTLVHDPEVLYLDEPTAGVDPILRERFWEHFRGLRNAGKSIVVPTQYVGEAVSCDLVAVMSSGRLLALLPPDRMAEHAYGGHPLVAHLGRGWLSAEEIDRMLMLPGVTSLRGRTDGSLLVMVDDPGAIEPLRAHIEQLGVEVRSIDPLDPTFDEIFVEIIEADRAKAVVR